MVLTHDAYMYSVYGCSVSLNFLFSDIKSFLRLNGLRSTLHYSCLHRNFTPIVHAGSFTSNNSGGKTVYCRNVHISTGLHTRPTRYTVKAH